MRKALITGVIIAGLGLSGAACGTSGESAPDPGQAAVKKLPPQMEPGAPGDENGNGQLDSSETPDNPDALPPQMQPGAPGDENGNGQLDSSETPDNPDA